MYFVKEIFWQDHFHITPGLFRGNMKWSKGTVSDNVEIPTSGPLNVWHWVAMWYLASSLLYAQHENSKMCFSSFSVVVGRRTQLVSFSNFENPKYGKWRILLNRESKLLPFGMF